MANSTGFKVALLLYPGFSNMVLACLLEPLRALRDQGQAQIEWVVLTPDDQPVESSSGLRITSDMPCHVQGSMDLLILISGYGYLRHAERPWSRTLTVLAGNAETVIAADTAAWLLAASGLLSQGRATVHWQVITDLAEAFPDLTVVQDRYVMEGRIWTCGGASTALDLILQMIGNNFGAARAFDVSTLFLHDAARQEQMYRGPARLTGKASGTLSRVLRDMASHQETPLALDELAARAALSIRSLNRLFRAELGMPPGRYYQMLRLARARDLAVETDLGLSQIALRCGFSGTPSLSKSFKNAFGYSIGKTRRSVG